MPPHPVFEKYRDRGLTGLGNLGNTCFINSCLQVLSHTYELNELLNVGTYKTRLNNKYESALLVEWDQLRTLMWSQNCVISPGKFLGTLQRVASLKGNDLFSGYQQNDLSEFFLFVVDCFHESLKREVEITITGKPENDTDRIAVICFETIKRMYAKEYSEIWSLFYGVHVSQILSVANNDSSPLSQTPEPFYMVHLSIPPGNKTPSLRDCFDHYVEGELMEGDNAWFNEKTGKKEDVKRSIAFWSFPTILALDIKRFNSRGMKNQVLVNFPLDDLDLSSYVIGYKKESYVYECYGICNHSGGTMGGHYTAFVKNANGKWYHCNDTLVKEVQNLAELITPKAYCLFYRKKVMA
jgi:ubiquitin carboxyl-terminal hydrolase 8